MSKKMQYSEVVNTYKDVWELQSLIREHDELVERVEKLRRLIKIKQEN